MEVFRRSFTFKKWIILYWLPRLKICCYVLGSNDFLKKVLHWYLKTNFLHYARTSGFAYPHKTTKKLTFKVICYSFQFISGILALFIWSLSLQINCRIDSLPPSTSSTINHSASSIWNSGTESTEAQLISFLENS